MCKTRLSQEPYSYIVPSAGHILPSTAVTGWRPLCSVSLLQEQKHLHKAQHNTGMAPAGAAARVAASTLALGLLLVPEPSQPCSLASGDGGLPWGHPVLPPTLGWLCCSVAQGWPTVPGTPGAFGAGALVVPEVGCAPRTPGAEPGLYRMWGCCTRCRGDPSELPTAAVQRSRGLGGSRELLCLGLDVGMQDCHRAG